MQSPHFNRVLLLASSGPIIWAVHFVAIYGFVGLVCARPQWNWQWLGIAATSWGVGLASVVALGVMAVLCWIAWARRKGPGDAYFIAYVTVLLAALSALAVVYETLTIWLVPSCV